MSKRTLSLLLALALSSAALASCGSTESQSDVTSTSSDASDETTPESVDTSDRSGVPDGTDLGGADINIWYTVNGTNYTDIAGEQTGDVLDDAVWSLNLAVQENLNCNLNLVTTGCDQRNCGTEISTLLLADDTSYDAFFATQWSGGKLVSEGLYLNVADAPYLSFDKPWWDLGYMREMSVGNDRIYTLVGDYAIDRTRYLTCVYYNKNLWNNFYGDPNGLYDSVENGEWDYDMLARVSSDVYQDLNNDGKMDRDDRLGTVLCWNDDIMSLLFCSGARITERDKDGIPHIVMNSERTMNVISDLFTLAKKSDGIFYGDKEESIEAGLNSAKFVSGTSLFMFGQFTTAELLREMTDDYGIVPIPKYNKDQENYFSTVYEVMRFMALPYNCQKTDAVCAVLEEMAFRGYNDVLPVYYETVLKNKYARDDISARMIDMIRSNLTADIAVIYGGGFAGLCYAPRDLIKSGSGEFASKFASMEKKATAESEKLIARFMDME